MKQNIINIYKFLVLKVYNQGSISKSNKSLDFFIETYRDVIDDEFVWNYVSFQLTYWSDKKTVASFNPSWVFGFKATERWRLKSTTWQYYTQQFLNKLQIERPVNYFKANMVDHFEQIRGRSFGTEEGLALCITNAFWSKGSKYCKVCEFKDFCKDGK